MIVILLRFYLKLEREKKIKSDFACWDVSVLGTT